MPKKKFKIPKSIKKRLPSILAAIIIGATSFFIGRQIGLNTDTSAISVTITDETVEKHTIKKTLTASGEIATTKTEKLYLSTSQYFHTMLVETDDLVKAGENILQYTDGSYLTAPYDLVISSISTPSTDTIASSSHYIEVKDTANLKVSVSINESEIKNLAVGNEAEITLNSNSKKYTGKISKISAVGSYSSSGATFPIEINLENDGDIKLGMSASCTISLQTLEDVIAAPVDAVEIDGDKRYVTLVNGGNTEQREVETGLSDSTYVEIKSGLEGGETIRITTTTKESTIRSSSSSEGGFNGRSFGGGNMPDMSNFDPSNMPDMSNMPSMPGSGSRPSRENR